MNTKQVSDLSDDELRIMVAELADWERGPEKDIRIHGLGIIASAGKCWHRRGEEDNWQDNPPDFPNDLNAMNEAEKTILAKDGFRWMEYLQECCGTPRAARNVTVKHLMNEYRADARQRAEAFVLAKENKT